MSSAPTPTSDAPAKGAATAERSTASPWRFSADTRAPARRAPAAVRSRVPVRGMRSSSVGAGLAERERLILAAHGELLPGAVPVRPLVLALALALAVAEVPVAVLVAVPAVAVAVV